MAAMSPELGAPIIQTSERRVVIPTNLVTGIVLAVFGYWVGVNIGNSFLLNDDLNTGVLLGYTFASVLFLVGIGFANYPLARLFGWPVSPQSAGDEYRGAWRYFNLSLDHKVIGIQ
ncbi:MAG: cytochrome c oxidase subunit, partial [Chloroflexota bacterium]|nr:cytochrome c oxidase subunit [Chloroflexota bacterium]